MNRGTVVVNYTPKIVYFPELILNRGFKKILHVFYVGEVLSKHEGAYFEE